VATPVNGGSDINDGKSKVTPVATLAKAIEIAQTCDPVCDVVVSAGTYPKTVTLASGIDLFGGYAPKTFMWDQVANEVKIEASENKAVIADGLNVKTRFFGFTVKAQSYMSDGASSYAFWVRNVADDNLAIEHSRVLAGNGGKGLDGVIAKAPDYFPTASSTPRRSSVARSARPPPTACWTSAWTPAAPPRRAR